MNFIRLETVSHDDIVINPNAISYFVESYNGVFMYMLGKKKPEHINASVSEIVSLLDEMSIEEGSK